MARLASLLLAAAAVVGIAVATEGRPAASTDDACTTWYDSVAHGATFRNVKTFGAVGDGVHDDTAAFVAALTAGRAPRFSTLQQAQVYVPPGKYKITGTLPLYFYTTLVGNFRCVPTLVLEDGVNPGYFIDGDTGDEVSEHTDEFYRGLSFLTIQLGANPGTTGLHWAMSQATYIRNVTVDASGAKAALFGENGSGGFIGDSTFIGGSPAAVNFGNQQWAFRNVVLRDAPIGMRFFWSWPITFLGLQVINCSVGLDLTAHTAGSINVLDSTFTDVGVALNTTYPQNVAQLLLERVTVTRVPTIAPGLAGSADGTATVASWRQGGYFLGSAQQPGVQSTLPLGRPDAPLPQRPRPVWDDGVAFVDAYSCGAKGDGVTDDTAALTACVAKNARVFLPAGSYLLSGTLELQPNGVLVGEGYSALVPNPASPAWADAAHPQPLLSLPAGGNTQIADLIFVTVGPVPGCTLLQWASGAGSGGWDVMWRIMHPTAGGWVWEGATAGGLMENSWTWVADHDIDTNANVTIVNPFGVRISTGAPAYLYGAAAEHSADFQFAVQGATSSVTFLLAQTESAYWQDPPTGWAMAINGSSATRVYSGAFWCWFYMNQSEIATVQDSPGAALLGLNTYGASSMVSGDATVPADASTLSWFTNAIAAFVAA